MKNLSVKSLIKNFLITERIRKCRLMYPAFFIRPMTHIELQSRTFYQISVTKIVFVIFSPIHPQTPDITILRSIVRSRYFNFMTVFQCNRCFPDQRRSDDILIATGTYRIKTQTGKHIPGRSLSVILIPAISTTRLY